MTQGPSPRPGSGYHHGVIAGWYPDPSGDWQLRWWDGVLWTADVVTGTYRSQEPIGKVPVPAVEQVLWDGEGHRLTTHRLWVHEPGTGRPPEELPLWTIASVDATASRVTMSVAYPGYGGRVTYVIRSTSAPLLGALVHAWANRNRRAAMRL